MIEYLDHYRKTVPIDINDVLPKESKGYARCQRLKNQVIGHKQRLLCDRARIITQSYRETEGQPILIRRAMALRDLLEKMRVYILPDEIIVGQTASQPRSAEIFPEYGVQWIKDEIDLFETRDMDSFSVSKEVKEEFLNDIYPYWVGRTLNDRIHAVYDDEIKLQSYDAKLFTIGLHETGGLGHVALDYELVLQKGFAGLRRDIEEKNAALKMSDPSSMKKRQFYEACLIVIEGVITFARRYADEARRMAEKETDAERKAELLLIAEVCGKVPENPATSFHEALQSFMIVQCIPFINDNATSYTPGRMDQYMFPYYEKDILSGKITKAQAQELWEALWIKFSESVKIYNAVDAASTGGQPTGNNVAISGVTPDGLDATNDLSYRCLEAHCHILLGQPNFTVRMHKKTPHEFLIRTCEAIRMGNGMPQVSNDEIFINSMLLYGVTLEEARDYATVGCLETMPRNTWGRANGGYFSLIKVLELVLSNGVCRITGKQVGPKTGDPREFKTFDDVLAAYEKQLNYSVEHMVLANNLIDMTHEELSPVPYVSMLVGDCISAGKDVTAGGARYNWTGPLGIGIANAADSFVAIKKAVFDDKIINMAELVDALDTNFEGREDLRLQLKNRMPKYGNDIAEADMFAKYVTDAFFKELKPHVTYRGGPFNPALMPVSSYVAFGLATGATPDGRKSGEPLADGVSPQNGLDKNGPTSVFKSVSCLDHVRCGNGVIFNQKMSPGPLFAEGGLEKFSSLIRSYLDLGGSHVQFNVVSADTLKEAQKNPEEYASLVVRVAGYSAFFNEISKEVQDSIIMRTEQQI
ncbi:MAG TPA: formate C-acetyltransferase/glycerol dehydratase family glycyl radical enzyme [Clostridiales bacterium]|nr:formate C-acetyltransferase/glycerol dehydratase family glycyl radical enzyme [Clostridiales bacterium]